MRLSSYGRLLRHAVRVPVKRFFSPKRTDGPQWSPMFEIVVSALREAFDISSRMTVAERRAIIDGLAQPSPLVFKVKREKVDANGVPATWFSPPKPRAAPVILFFHGGAYQFGSVKSYTDTLCRLALASGCRVLAIEYRLAPEHPFPAPLEDARKAWSFLRENAYSVALAGDSAGGNLALSLAIDLRERNEPRPVRLALVCPWVDLGEGGPSRQSNAHHDTLPSHVEDQWALTYAAGHDLRDPRISPAFADLHDLPPMLVHAGGREIIRDDIRLFVDRARKAGCEVHYDEYEEMVHDWHMFAAVGIPESVRALEEIGTFLVQGARPSAHAERANAVHAQATSSVKASKDGAPDAASVGTA